VIHQRFALSRTRKPRVIQTWSGFQELFGQRRHRVDAPLLAINHQ